MTLLLRIVAAALLLHAEFPSASAQRDAPREKTGAMFKKPQLAINDATALPPVGEKSGSADSGVAPALTPAAPAASKAAATAAHPQDAEALDEKLDTLKTDIAFAKKKLAESQRKLAIQNAAGNTDLAEKITNEVKDWEGRLKVSEAQLTAVEIEIDRLKPRPQLGGPDVILPGENLELFVNEDQSFNGRYPVRRGGYIILPQVGRIAVAGKSLEQAELAVRRALEGSQLTTATVLVERISGSDVETGPLIYLHGEFKNPRPYRIPPGTAPTVVSVLLSCGGTTEHADLTKVKIMRMAAGKPVMEEVNVARMLDGAGLASDLTLSEGDVITIPTGPSSQIFVTGNVKHQGAVTYTVGEKLTVYGSILRAGGFARFAKENGVYILRAMPDGTKRKIACNIEDVKKGRKQDVVLQASDIVVVPEKFFSF